MRWGLVFLACPVSFSDAQTQELVRLAARAWFEDCDRVPIDWPDMRGEVVARGEAVSLGSFFGQRFGAEVHRPDIGDVAFVEFLVAESALQGFGPQAPAEA